ncbi:MAG: LbtU family siderophore porin [Gammaproteobacteria bacterium]|nr:LbtU family siderophore porin [Gammaproteobacteria bacterium]
MKLKSISVGLVIFLLCPLAFATTNSTATTKQNHQTAASNAAQLKALQQQLDSLKIQVAQVQNNTKQEQLEQKINTLQSQIQKLETQQKVYPKQPYVMLTPYLGVPKNYQGYDLITNFADVNEDLVILQQRQEYAKYLASKAIPIPDHPMLQISGYVEGQAFTGKDYTGHTYNDINLSGAELKLLGEISPWASAYMVFSYDDGPNATYNFRANNSRVYLSRAYATFGNLNKMPFYLSIGQMYVPFGMYQSYMITDSLAKTLGKTKERPVIFGFAKGGVYAAMFGYKGDSYSDDRGQTINGWGANLGFKTNNKTVNVDIGSSYIQNIADSEGMQDTYSDSFGGFGDENNGNQHLAHQVPALDLHAVLYYADSLRLYSEYITALRSFSSQDLTFNGKSADVSALTTQINYMFHIKGQPSSIAVGYQQAWETLGLNIPEYAFLTDFSISFFKDTVEKIEYRHAINYKSSDMASGSGGTTFGPEGSHRAENTVTAEIDFYF